MATEPSVVRDLQQSGDGGARPRAIMPPYLVLRDFLEKDTVAGLLGYTLAHEQAFKPTKVGHVEDGQIEPMTRVSLGTRDLGPFKPILTSKILGRVSELVAELRVTPVAEPKLELQLVAHNDGAFYKQHIDTQTAADRENIRVLSGVYYFYGEPKGFAGGALRLYGIGDAAKATFADIEPAHNSLLVFPSWARHEVMTVSCPSRRFADSRFAINCWILRKRAVPAGSA